jgi:hypothetical protein
MSHFKLLVCTAILLLLSQAASAQADYINIFAGGGPNNVPATTAPVYSPRQLAFDSAGNVYFSTFGTAYQNRVYKLNVSTGIFTIVAGTYSDGYSGDGDLAVNAQLNNPTGVAVDHAGNVFIADQTNYIVREVNVSTGIITTIAGTPKSAGFGGDGLPATSAKLYNPAGIALDKNGNLFIADQSNQRIRVVACAAVTSSGGACTPNAGEVAGDIYTVAGTGSAVYNGDNIPATTANLYNPYNVATDTAGNLYIADWNDNLIRRVACGTGISSCTAPSGETSAYIYTLAGTGESAGHTGTAGYNGDGAAATSSDLNQPLAVSIDTAGNLFIADYANLRIREVSCVTKTSSGGACTPSTGQTAGDIYTVAGDGTGGYNGDGQAATTAYVYYPQGVAVDSAGDLFIGDYDNNLVREVPCDVSSLSCTPPTGDTKQFIYTVAGNRTTSYYGNNVPATGAELNYPAGAASDSQGNIYIADRNNCVVREVSASTGEISTFAGVPGTCGYNSDGIAATSAYLNYPYKVTVDTADNVYIADTNNCLIRKVAGGTISTFAGSHSLGCGYSGDGAAASVKLYYPAGVAVDPSGDLYIADQDNYLVRKVTAGNLVTFAGNYTLGAGYSGDGGLATAAQLRQVFDVAVDTAGNVYIADEGNLRIRKVNADGIITTFAGNGAGGYQGDGGLAYETSLYYPQSVAVDWAGDVIIADTDNNRIRLVNPAEIIYTIAGTGAGNFYGNDVLATAADLNQSTGVSVDPSGNIYVSDYNNWLVREISALIVLNPSPASVNFDTQTVKTTSDPVAVTLSANGGANIASIKASADFNETDDCPNTLSSSSCTVEVSFSPTAPGFVNGTLTVTYDGFFAPTAVVSLQGEATSLTWKPSSLAFGSKTVGTSTTKTVTVTGGTTYSSPSATIDGNTTDFTIASNTCTGAVTKSCIIGVKFNPQSSGAKKATLLIHDSDPTSPQLVGMTGSGTTKVKE